MRASVSDILLFRKCPKAWWLSKRWQPKVIAKPLEIGLDIHSKVEKFLRTGLHWEGSEKYIAPLDAIYKEYEILAVENPFNWEFRGHSLLGRPDAVLSHRNTPNSGYPSRGYTFQLKTVSKRLPAHLDIVRYSPHEAVYAAAAEHFLGIEITGIILCRYVKVKEPIILLNHITTTKTDRARILDSVEDTLNQMEHYAKKFDYEIPQHTSSCWDWTTGHPCQYVPYCYARDHSNPDNLGFKPATDRYPEFGGGSGVAGHALPDSDKEWIKFDSPDTEPQEPNL